MPKANRVCPAADTDCDEDVVPKNELKDVQHTMYESWKERKQ